MNRQIQTLRVRRLCIGMPASFGPGGIQSGIDKRQTEEALFLGRLGFAGDGQGDLRHHGGPDKAVHHYCSDYFGQWKKELVSAADRFDLDAPFGENIVGESGKESDVCIGDVFSLGSAILQVSQARQPCWKLNVRFGVKDMARRVQDSGRTGWYYRILKQGIVAQDDHLNLIDRPRPDWTLTRVLDVLYRRTLDRRELSELSGLAELSDSWKDLMKRRLERMEVEDWSDRLRS